MNKPIELGPLNDPVDPVALRAMQERRELLRIASQRALDLHKKIRHLDDDQLRQARIHASQPPLVI